MKVWEGMKRYGKLLENMEMYEKVWEGMGSYGKAYVMYVKLCEVMGKYGNV